MHFVGFCRLVTFTMHSAKTIKSGKRVCLSKTSDMFRPQGHNDSNNTYWGR